jgi:hypothetical protein
MTLQMTFENRQNKNLPAPIPPDCGAPAGGNANSAAGKVTYTDDFAKNPAARGFGRDTCHYTDSCPGTGGEKNFGDGVWDRVAYMAANHPGITPTDVANAIGGGKTVDTLSRWDVYQWEIANKATGKLDPLQVGATVPDAQNPKIQGQNASYGFTKQCAFSKPWLAPTPYPPE